ESDVRREREEEERRDEEKAEAGPGETEARPAREALSPASFPEPRRLPIYGLNGGLVDIGGPADGYFDIPDAYLRKAMGVGGEEVGGICVLGSGMEPTLREGDLAIVTLAARLVDRDGIYLFKVGGEVFLKRLQRRPGRLLVQSDNPAYPCWEMTAEEMERLDVLGRVIGWLRGHI
ncbi:MAG: S24 family peptidase, partial [Rhodospirillales bacterium]|nr:S24 family peptidase [Rhodospirillales bacterium]